MLEMILKKLSYLTSEVITADFSRHILNYKATSYVVDYTDLRRQVMKQFKTIVKNDAEFKKVSKEYQKPISNLVAQAVNGMREGFAKAQKTNRRNLIFEIVDKSDKSFSVTILYRPENANSVNIFELIKDINFKHKKRLFDELKKFFNTTEAKLENFLDLGRSHEVSANKYAQNVRAAYMAEYLDSFFGPAGQQIASQLASATSLIGSYSINSKGSIELGKKSFLDIEVLVGLESAHHNRKYGAKVEKKDLQRATEAIKKAIELAATTQLTPLFTKELATATLKRLMEKSPSISTTRKLASFALREKAVKGAATPEGAKETADKYDLRYKQFSGDPGVLTELMLDINILLSQFLRSTMNDYKKGMDLSGKPLHNRSGSLATQTRITNLKNKPGMRGANDIEFDIEYRNNRGNFSYSLFDPSSPNAIPTATPQRNPNEKIRVYLSSLLSTRYRDKIPNLGKVTAYGQDKPHA